MHPAVSIQVCSPVKSEFTLPKLTYQGLDVSIQVCSPVKSEKHGLSSFLLARGCFPFKCVHPLRVSGRPGRRIPQPILSIQVCSPVKSEQKRLVTLLSKTWESFPFKCVHPLRVSCNVLLLTFNLLFLSIQVCSPVKSEFFVTAALLLTSDVVFPFKCVHPLRVRSHS